MHRTFFAVSGMLIAGLGLCTSAVHAGIVFADGQIHTLVGPNPDVTLIGGSGVIVPTGASIVATPGFDGVSGLAGLPDSVSLSGGSITGGFGLGSQTSGGDGVRLIGTFNASSGSITGGIAPSAQGASAGDALVVVGSATISGGTFTGGAANGLASSAGGRGLLYTGNGPGQSLTISGGTFMGTSGPLYAPVGLGAAITLVGSTGAITGGTFIGQSPQFFTGGAMTIVAQDDARMTVSGGHFDGNLDLFANTGSVIDFLGTGLQFSYNNLLGNGYLSGTLADGSVISTEVVSYIQDYTRERPIAGGIEFYAALPGAIPEPWSLTMVGLGMVGFATISKTLRSRSASPRP